MACGCGRTKGDALAASAARQERIKEREQRIAARAAERGGRPALWSGKPQAEPEQN